MAHTGSTGGALTPATANCIYIRDVLVHLGCYIFPLVVGKLLPFKLAESQLRADLVLKQTSFLFLLFFFLWPF